MSVHPDLCDQVLQSMDAMSFFSQDTGEMLDGMGHRNIYFNPSEKYIPQMRDLLPPTKEGPLDLARIALGKISQEDSHHVTDDEWQALLHALNYVRTINAFNACSNACHSSSVT